MLATARNIKGLSFYLSPPYKLSFGKLSDEQFDMVCRKHPDLKFELTSKGELLIMPPTLPDTGWKNSRLNTRTDLWSLETNSGFVFDSSTIFTFKNGAKRSPDVAWIAREKWDQFTAEQKRKSRRLHQIL